MQERGEVPSWPPNPAPYLVDWLIEIGPTQTGGMGEGPLGWQEMTAWERLTGIELDPFEARALRRMSRAFLHQKQDAKKPDCPIPYSGRREEIIANRDAVAAKVKGVFAGLKRKKG